MLLKAGHTKEIVKHHRSKYPWELLKNVGDFFDWSCVKDAPSIRSSAKNAGVSVRVSAVSSDCVRVLRVG